MAAVAAQPQALPTSSRSSSVVNGASTAGYTNGHGDLMESEGHAPIAPSNKKAKSKKAADPNETSKLLAAKISQLEFDKAGEKDQEAEIGKWRNNFLFRPTPHPTASRFIEPLSALHCPWWVKLSRP